MKGYTECETEMRNLKTGLMWLEGPQKDRPFTLS